MRRVLSGVLLVFALTGCSPTPEALWRDYLGRLARLAGQPEPTLRTPAPPPWPRHRLLRQSLPEPRTGLMRYLDLQHCGLRQLVSERNTILGRVQAPSLRLDYELAFIERARRCLDANALQDAPELRHWLQTLLRTKEDMVAGLYWNATLGGRELDGFFSYSAGAPLQAPADHDRVLRALERLTRLATRLRQPPFPANTPGLETALRRLDRSETGGQLLAGILLADNGLREATALLRGIDPQRLCPRGHASQTTRRLQRVFTAIYAQRVQPWLSDIWHAARPLGQQLRALRQAIPLENSALDTWLSQTWGTAGIGGRLEARSRDHARAWQRLLEPCGLAPRRPGG